MVVVRRPSCYVGQHYEVQMVAGSQTVTKCYYANGKRVAFRRDGAVYYVHSDNLGSANKITDSSGAVKNSYLYYPWGSARERTEQVAYDYRYNGQRAVDSAGMYYYGAGAYGRFYDPVLARWTQADSIVPRPGDPQAGNRYSYTGNNPLKYIDPNGHYYLFIGGMFTTVATNWNAFSQMMTGLGLDPNNPTAGEGWGIFQWGNGTPGDSAGGTTINQAVGDLTTALDGKEDIKLIGHSRGGNLAIEFGARMAEGSVSPNSELRGVYSIDGALDVPSPNLGQRWVLTPDGVIDRYANLPQRLAAKGVNTDIATFDNKLDYVNHPPLPGTDSYEWNAGQIPNPFNQQNEHGKLLHNPKVGETIRGHVYYHKYGLSHAD